jgi:hypothetical protein
VPRFPLVLPAHPYRKQFLGFNICFIAILNLLLYSDIRRGGARDHIQTSSILQALVLVFWGFRHSLQHFWVSPQLLQNKKNNVQKQCKINHEIGQIEITYFTLHSSTFK